jgi:Trp operon repressor
VLQQQHRNITATRAAETVSQRFRNACYNIVAVLLRRKLQQRKLASLQCSATACHRHSASLHRCSAAPLPAIAAAAAKLGTSDVS